MYMLCVAVYVIYVLCMYVCIWCVYVYMWCVVCVLKEFLCHLLKTHHDSQLFFIWYTIIIMCWINLKWQISILFDYHCKPMILKCCWLDWLAHFNLWVLWRSEVLKNQGSTSSWVWDCSLFGGEPARREVLSPHLLQCSPGCCLNEGLGHWESSFGEAFVRWCEQVSGEKYSDHFLTEQLKSQLYQAAPSSLLMKINAVLAHQL